MNPTTLNLNLNVLRDSLKACAEAKVRIRSAGEVMTEVVKSAQEVAKNAPALREVSRGEKNL